jgi:arylsulfatase A-like enzyme
MNLIPRTKLLPMLPLLGALGACTEPQQEAKAPNIIFIMTDDHAWQAVSAYGERLAEAAPTPNIDRLAEEGMRFDRCLVTNSICGPSRATILTGKYGHLNGFYSNEMADFDGTQQTFPKLFQEAGYQTAVIGKWHLGSTPTGFHHWDILPGQGHYYNPTFINSEGNYDMEGYVTDIITDKTLEWLQSQRDKDKPFMVMMHHKAPHREWEPALKYLGHFDNIQFPIPETLFDDHSGRGTAAREQDMSIAISMRMDGDLKMWRETTNSAATKQGTYGRLTDEQRKVWDAYYNRVMKELDDANPQGAELVKWKYQRYLQDYLGTILSVDESVGRILDYLKETGMDKNTIVVYTSDQGFFLGEHGWFDKRFMYEISYRTPLLIRWPGVTQPHSVNRNIVSNLDFAQTFLDAAGIPLPTDMQGASLVPLLKGNTPDNWRKEHYYHYYAYPDWHMVKRHYGIADERYKLIHFYFDIDEWELYDLEKDPNEMRNVYNDPAYAEVREDLHKRLLDLREKYGDSDELMNSFLP